ncbi:sulfur oxidation c-type cytochrome SoxA [Tardiphaga alba]|uniref:SoxAX cytochrome complex subunit A n=1 Tax=Tardiphaga alba TaxID=340268 RepID=A0ABX8AAZ0_9BRAD|nr:sulfur oxidation c-type cytochrome SoxA [Tardiphaga alba]QUS40461.1 sulfur oxidation c-type cytochrome SoxA [Tardiphaga alba]
MISARAIIAFLLVWLAMPLSSDAAEIAPDQRRSGSSFMAPETRAMQDDDTSNPGMLWVLDGYALWKAKSSPSEKSCTDCHGDIGAMRGVSAKYPAFDEVLKQPVDLEQRINLCRTRHQDEAPLADDSRELLALTALIGRQSRGLPIEAGNDPRVADFVAKGRDLFTRRQGQLNLACSNCHDDNWDRQLAGSSITQAHPTGYPLYRLEWQSLGSLKRRLRNCMTGVRAQPYANDSEELINLQLYLASRANGLAVETPAIRP